MEAVSGEITLYDLMAWEPRIHAVSPLPESPQYRSLTSIEVDWVVTARSTQPMLPTLRGGELIILPDRIVQEIGLPLNSLVKELSLQPIAGVLTDNRGIPDRDNRIAVLQMSRVDNETERDLNRLLTNGRRLALQRVAELDQVIAEAGARGSRPSELIDRLSQLIEIPITVHTPGATTLFTTGHSRDVPSKGADTWVRGSLRNGYTLWLGPVEPSRHAIARFALAHVRESLQRALDSTVSMAPRGNARVTALNALLLEPDTTNRDALSQRALNVGVPPDRSLRVAISSAAMPEAQVRRSLQQLGDIFDAGELHGNRLWLLASRAEIPALGRLGNPQDGWLAVSTAVEGPADLPKATRQARYAGMLLSSGLIPGGGVAFEDSGALGIYGLLYPNWETDVHRSYRDQHIGALIGNDPRGQLIDTLGVYLDQGGSQRHAAEALGIHRNTLSYRMRQIDQSMDVDLDDPHVRLTLHVAIAIHRILTL